jgi:hypothetical protein
MMQFDESLNSKLATLKSSNGTKKPGTFFIGKNALK